MNSSSHSTQRGSGTDEHPLGFFLHDSHEGVHFLDSLFSHFERRGEFLVRRGDRLTDLLHVNAH